MKQSIQELVELSKQDGGYISELWSIFDKDCMEWAKKVQKTPEDILDLYNEAYIILGKAVETYDIDRGSDFERYYRSMLKYEGQRYRKKYDKRMSREIYLPGKNEEGDIYDGLADTRINVEKEVVQHMAIDQMYKALEKLTEDERYILIAFYFNNHSIEKISHHMGVSCDAIDSKKRRTLKKVQRICDGFWS